MSDENEMDKYFDDDDENEKAVEYVGPEISESNEESSSSDEGEYSTETITEEDSRNSSGDNLQNHEESRTFENEMETFNRILNSVKNKVQDFKDKRNDEEKKNSDTELDLESLKQYMVPDKTTEPDEDKNLVDENGSETGDDTDMPADELDEGDTYSIKEEIEGESEEVEEDPDEDEGGLFHMPSIPQDMQSYEEEQTPDEENFDSQDSQEQFDEDDIPDPDDDEPIKEEADSESDADEETEDDEDGNGDLPKPVAEPFVAKKDARQNVQKASRFNKNAVSTFIIVTVLAVIVIIFIISEVSKAGKKKQVDEQKKKSDPAENMLNPGDIKKYAKTDELIESISEDGSFVVTTKSGDVVVVYDEDGNLSSYNPKYIDSQDPRLNSVVAWKEYTSAPAAANTTGTVNDSGRSTQSNSQTGTQSQTQNSSQPVTNSGGYYSPVSQTSSGGGGGTSYSGYSSAGYGPDTVNDRLQGLSIRGIKGLSSTQNSYATDYETTLMMNSDPENARLTKDEFMEKYMNMYGSTLGTTGSSSSSQTAYATQNDQSGKNDFHQNGAEAAGNGTWLPINSLWEGTIFEVALKTAVNTDIPGEISAIVTKNVYSSKDGSLLLIPQNSLIFGTYNSSVTYGQKRVQIAWNTIIRPDGYRISLGNMNATDNQGAAGARANVNDHPLQYLKAVGLMTVISIANGEFQNTIDTTTNPYLSDLATNSQSVMGELGDKMVDRAMNVQPTLTIKAGQILKVMVNQSIVIPAVR